MIFNYFFNLGVKILINIWINKIFNINLQAE